MNRRGFLSSILAMGMAPAIVRAESLMRVKQVLLPGEDFNFTSAELNLSFREFNDKYVKPALNRADQITRESLLLMEKHLVNKNLLPFIRVRPGASMWVVGRLV
jgi:hypothetical protein